jgi:uncharacterized protein
MGAPPETDAASETAPSTSTAATASPAVTPGLWRQMLPVAAAVAIGVAGGAVFYALRLPLAWMLGALSFTTVAALAGLKLRFPHPVRAGMASILGIMLGSAFLPDTFARATQWLVSISGLGLSILITVLLVYTYLRGIGGLGPITAYFTAMPGGLNEMTMLGSALGGDERMIALNHGWRLFIVVFAIPFWFRFHEGYVPPSFGGSGTTLSAAIAGLDLLDAAMLAACGLVGAALARLARLPAPTLTGPMILSAAVHLTGLTSSRLPVVLVYAAQVAIGTALGCRFVGIRLRVVARALRVGSGATLMMLANTVGCSLAVVGAVTGTAVPALLLAYAPGGLAEMSLIALALGIDVAFVSMHQLLRILIVIVLAPAFFRLMPKGDSTACERPVLGDD